MSVRVMSWVFAESMSTGNNRLVLLAIADRAADDGTDAWPSLATIAEKAHVSRRTAIRAIQALEELGELEVDRSHGGRETNLYRVLMRSSSGDNLTPLSGDNLSPRQSDTGDTVVTAAVTLLSPNTSIRPITPQPPASGGRDHCDEHKRHRKSCEDCMAAAASLRAKPEWCGECDERTRLVEDLDAACSHRCPDCHPLNRRTA